MSHRTASGRRLPGPFTRTHERAPFGATRPDRAARDADRALLRAGPGRDAGGRDHRDDDGDDEIPRPPPGPLSRAVHHRTSSAREGGTLAAARAGASAASIAIVTTPTQTDTYVAASPATTP